MTPHDHISTSFPYGIPVTTWKLNYDLTILMASTSTINNAASYIEEMGYLLQVTCNKEYPQIHVLNVAHFHF